MITLKDAANQWYHNHGRHLKDAKNLDSIKTQVLLVLGGGKSVANYGTADVMAVAEDMRARGLAPATIKRNLGVLRRIINYACDHGHEVPAIKWPRIKTKPKMRHLTGSEQQLLLNRVRECKSWPVYTLLLLLLDTGMRLSEALSLRETDFAGDEIILYRPKTETTTRLPVSRCVKNHLKGKTFPVLRGWERDLRKAIAYIADPLENERHGKPTIHSLRDTFATNMLRKGLPIQDVSYLLGHSSIQQTMKYAHVIPSDVQERARRLLDA